MAKNKDKVARALAGQANQQVSDVTNINSSNLFNPNVASVNYTLLANGNITPSTNWVVSDYISVTNGQSYFLDTVSSYAFYDNTKTFISKFDSSPNISFEIIPPSNAVYLRICFYTNYMALNSMVVSQGTSLFDSSNVSYKIKSEKIMPLQKKLNLPPTIYSIVGSEIRVYFKSLIDNINIDDYIIQIYSATTITSSEGVQKHDYFSYTPASARTLTPEFSFYDKKTGALVAKQRINLVSKATSVGNGITRKVLIIGDSTTNAGDATQRVLNLAGTDVFKVTLMGTRGTSPNLHEGRGGWAASTYCTQTSFNTYTNAFLFGGVFNFSQYMSTNGFTAPDYVIINLGINDATPFKNDVDAYNNIPTILGYYDTMINSIKTYNSNIKIGVAITIPPNDSQDVFGTNNGILLNQARYKRSNYQFVKALIAKYINQESNKIYLIPIHANLDTQNNMGDHVHPLSTAGYYQIGDVYWNWLKSFES